VKYYLILGLSMILLSASGAAMPLCDYHAPVSDLSHLGMNFSYHYYNDPYGLHDRDINAGELKIDYAHLYDSPNFGYDILAKNDMMISVLSLSSYQATAEGSVKRYFAPESAYFGFAGAAGKASSSYKTIGLSVNLGLGYGRFADVTPLVKAMEIDEYLVRRGSLSDHLSDVDLQALAHEIDNQATYGTTADLLAALQEIIEGSGLTKPRGLDALDISEMSKIIADNTHSRYCGGEVKLGVSYEILDPMGGPNDLLATAAVNYAFTATPKSQFLVQGSLSGSYDILKTHQLELTLNYDYLLSELLSLSGSYTFSQEAYGGQPTNSHNISVEVSLTPVKTARVTLEVRLSHEPYYLEWSQEVRLSIGMDLL